MSQTATSEVFTLEEAANYLKLPLDTIEREASRGHIPGRRIEDTWRFLKSAIDDWLRAQDSRDVLLQQAGALKDDPYLDELLDIIYRGRKQSETDSDLAGSACRDTIPDRYRQCVSQATQSIVQDIAKTLDDYASRNHLILFDADSNYEQYCIIDGEVSDITKEFIDYYNRAHSNTQSNMSSGESAGSVFRNLIELNRR